MKQRFRHFLILEPIYKALIQRLLIIYAIFSLARLVFYISNHSFFKETCFWDLPGLMLGGLLFDTLAILYTNLLFILLHLIPFKIRYHEGLQKFLKYWFFVTNAVIILANTIDIAYYPFNLKRTTFSFFSQFKNETNFLKLFSLFIIDYWYIALFFFFSIFLMVKLYNKVKLTFVPESSSLVYYAKAIILLPIFSLLVVAGLRGGFRYSTRPITLSNAGDYVKRTSEVNIVLNTPFCIFKTIEIPQLKKATYFKNQKDLEAIYNPIHHKNDSIKAPFNKLNVVLIILESFGKESIGFFNKNLENGNYKGFTPFFDSLCTESLVFEKSFANGRRSIDAIPACLASVPFIQESFVLSEYFDNKLMSLPSLLKAENYHTSFFHGAPNGSMGFSAFVNLIGIDNYFGKTEYNNDNDFDGTWGIWDEPFFQFFANKITTFPQPFFTSIFSVTSHHPFELPPNLTNKFPKGKHPICKTIGYTDWALKRFFETAKKQPWFNNTLFVITADHCQSIPVHDEYNTYPGLFSVPIIFYSPNKDLKLKGIVTDKLIQQIDIMPTTLALLNYNKPFFSFGNNITDKSKDHFVVNYIDNSYLIFYKTYALLFNGNKTLALYDYSKDIFLKNNIKDSLPKIKNQMELMAKAFIQQFNNRMIDKDLVVE